MPTKQRQRDHGNAPRPIHFDIARAETEYGGPAFSSCAMSPDWGILQVADMPDKVTVLVVQAKGYSSPSTAQGSANLRRDLLELRTIVAEQAEVIARLEGIVERAGLAHPAEIDREPWESEEVDVMVVELRGDVTLEAAKAEVGAYVVEHPQSHAFDIASALRLPLGVVEEAAEDLVREGVLTKGGHGTDGTDDRG